MGWVDRLKRFGLVGTVDLNCERFNDFYYKRAGLISWYLIIQPRELDLSVPHNWPSSWRTTHQLKAWTCEVWWKIVVL